MPFTDGRTGEPHFKLKLQNSLVRSVCAFSKRSQILANSVPGLSTAQNVLELFGCLNVEYVISLLDVYSFWMATEPVLKFFTSGKKCEGPVETVAAEYTNYHLLASRRW